MKGRGLLDALRPASPRPASAPGWVDGNGWSAFLDRLSDPILVFDTGSRVAFANTAALRLVPCEAGTPVARLTASLGAEAVGWLSGADGGGPTGRPPPVRLADSREAALAWQRLDKRHAALRLVLPVERPWPEGEPATVGVAGPLREARRMLRDSPFPVSLQGEDFRFIDVNAAFVEFSGRGRETLNGIDSLEFVPAEDHAAIAESRQRAAGPHGHVEFAYGDEGRLIDAGGRERWFRAAGRALRSEEGAPLYLAVHQEKTSEHVAR